MGEIGEIAGLGFIEGSAAIDAGREIDAVGSPRPRQGDEVRERKLHVAQEEDRIAHSAQARSDIKRKIGPFAKSGKSANPKP